MRIAVPRRAPGNGAFFIPEPMLKTSIALWLLLAASAAAGHEFWLLPDQFRLQPGTNTVSLTLSVGENFQGERVAFSQPLVAEFLHVAGRRKVDLRPAVKPKAREAFALDLRASGTHVLALTTHPSELVLPAEQFHAYLREEGLDRIIRARAAAGQADTPGRERYRRTIKTLLQGGQAGDGSHSTRVGQKLEIVPLSDPSQHGAGDELAFQVLFDGRPLVDALVKFWHRGDERTRVVRTVTNQQGSVRLAPDAAGVWMASVVHMVPAIDSPRHDWDSYWGNLTFELRDDDAGP